MSEPGNSSSTESSRRCLEWPAWNYAKPGTMNLLWPEQWSLASLFHLPYGNYGKHYHQIEKDKVVTPLELQQPWSTGQWHCSYSAMKIFLPALQCCYNRCNFNLKHTVHQYCNTGIAPDPVSHQIYNGHMVTHQPYKSLILLIGWGRRYTNDTS
jgi:hypothetical protein